MSDEDEYEIESIVEARVEKEKGRKAKLAWKFRVRWKGYSPDDDTWEPVEHLVGSEETLSHFWERINTSGRNHRDLRLFEAGEVFLPIGPPRKRKFKGTETPVKDIELKGDVVEATSEIDHVPLSRLRKRGHDVDTDPDDERFSKRPRPAQQTFGSKPNLLLTDGSTPVKSISRGTPDPMIEQAKDLTPPRNSTPNPGFKAQDGTLASPNFGSTDLLVPARNTVSDGITTPPSKNVKPSMPLHRARVANPLVKILNDHHLASLKSHESNQGTSSEKQTSPPRRKPGPGRSSDGLLIRSATLLTAEKGKLKSIKGKDRLGSRVKRANDTVTKDGDEQTTEVTINQEVPVEPPEPSKILELAGLDPCSGNLSDYEDEVIMKPSASAEVIEPGKSDLPLPPATNSLFLSTIPDTESNPMWKRSTIFGPLGLGTDAPSLHGSVDSNNSATPFQLTLDSSTTIPVLFVDAVPSAAFTNSAISQRGPPGKFYCGMYANDLLGTLRTKGSFARVVPSAETKNDEQDNNFKHFTKRLASNELFVAMVDRDLLAFCSSSNALFVQRLNIPPSLLTIESILVAHVSIEDYSAFADATANADDTIWSQYILSAGDV